MDARILQRQEQTTIHKKEWEYNYYHANKAKLHLLKKDYQRRHPLSVVLQGMRARCQDKNAHNYRWYGGRGIKVCDEWNSSFRTFEDWALANGYKKGLTIDRINNDGDYEPSNCRWITNSENRLRQFR